MNTPAYVSIHMHNIYVFAHVFLFLSNGPQTTEQSVNYLKGTICLPGTLEKVPSNVNLIPLVPSAM